MCNVQTTSKNLEKKKRVSAFSTLSIDDMCFVGIKKLNNSQNTTAFKQQA